jgi:hypothetical protein
VKYLLIILVLLISACSVPPGEYLIVPATNITPDYVYCEGSSCWQGQLINVIPTVETMECEISIRDTTNVYLSFDNFQVVSEHSGIGIGVQFYLTTTQQWVNIQFNNMFGWVLVDNDNVTYDELGPCTEIHTVRESTEITLTPEIVVCTATAVGRVNFRESTNIYSYIYRQLEIGETGVWIETVGNWHRLNMSGDFGWAWKDYINIDCN